MGGAPVPPPPPPPPAAGAPGLVSIRTEPAPSVDHPKIGLEIEGVGNYSTRWDIPAVVNQDNFHDVFKRTPLVRSPSFNNLDRGVAITPEDGNDFGRSGPAELVSAPHVLTVENLVRLRNSVWKALRKSDFATVGIAPFLDRRLPVLPSPIAETRWARNRLARIGRSLQVTIGVNTVKLLNSVEEKRRATSRYLIKDPTKLAGFDEIATAAVVAQQFFTQPGAIFQGATRLQILGARLMFLMTFLSTCRSIVGAGGWGKDTYGCNIKAYTSFLGCGMGANFDLQFAHLLHRVTPAVLKGLLLDHLEATGVTPRVIAALDLSLDMKKIGKPGLSAQTAIEEWFAIPNFVKGTDLYCVIEVREGDAPLNIAVQTFLNASQGSVPQPSAGGDLFMKQAAQVLMGNIQKHLL